MAASFAGAMNPIESEMKRPDASGQGNLSLLPFAHRRALGRSPSIELVDPGWQASDLQRSPRLQEGGRAEHAEEEGQVPAAGPVHLEEALGFSGLEVQRARESWREGNLRVHPIEGLPGAQGPDAADACGGADGVRIGGIEEKACRAGAVRGEDAQSAAGKLHEDEGSGSGSATIVGDMGFEGRLAASLVKGEDDRLLRLSLADGDIQGIARRLVLGGAEEVGLRPQAVEAERAVFRREGGRPPFCLAD